MFKKAQAAMEFLMTYGWAILVVLVAIGALAYFGVLSPDKMLPEKCIISSGSGLFCDKFSVGTNFITIKVKNSLAEQVIITNASVTDIACNPFTTADNVTIAASGTGNIEFTNCTLGSKISEDLAITFTDEDDFIKSTTGTLVAQVPG